MHVSPGAEPGSPPGEPGADGLAAPVAWSPTRSRHQGRLVDSLWRQAGEVPAERRLVLAGGLRGAAKDVALAKAGLGQTGLGQAGPGQTGPAQAGPGRVGSLTGFLAVSVDRVLAEMSRRSLIPVVAGRAPLEAAGLVHAEAQHVAKRLAARAMATGTNVLLDVTAASWPSVRSWLHVADLAAYSLDVVIADFSADEAVRWAAAEHARRQAAYRRGAGDGGRDVPAAAIRAAAPLAAAAGDWPWPRHIAHLNRWRPVRFPGGEVTQLIGAWRAGQLTLAGLAGQFRDRAWPATAPACPSEALDAGPAIDDLEPWQPGSFDEVVLARDLGLLTDEDYATLAGAAFGVATERRSQVTEG
jgi:hypothetical protein